MASVITFQQRACRMDECLASRRCPFSRPVQAATTVLKLRGSCSCKGTQVTTHAVAMPEARPSGLSQTRSGKEGSPLVKDIMTSGKVFVAKPDTTVDEALELICTHRVSGMPVVDDDNFVVGVVSDFDLLNLDGVLAAEERAHTNIMFPEVGKSWNTFKDIKLLLAKTGGKYVREVMTQKPITIRGDVSMDDASRILMTKRIRRLPVVDEEGRLVGVLSRGNIVRAVLQAHMAQKAREMQ